ncbi:MAG: NAD(P)/FAD-dependent oxidoreductase [Pseudomonadota bacterium]
MRHEVLIIGGGLSGLSLLRQLRGVGCDARLLEARDRLGGRIKAWQFGGQSFDLGPAWFWPEQPRIRALVKELGLRSFMQWSDGAQCFEDSRGRIERWAGMAPMAGSLRLAGGLSALIHALAAALPADAVRLNAKVDTLEREAEGITARVGNKSYSARQVVIASPPRVIATTVEFVPALPAEVAQVLGAVPTWMAGQAKVLALYERPFWRNAGLSGDAMSHLGPMVEIHDASPLEGAPYALFGFVGVPAAARRDKDRLLSGAQAQLRRLFGPEAGEPIAMTLKDWAWDTSTATERDLKPMRSHPTYGRPALLNGLWDGRLHFAGTEVAESFGGFLEGALSAAEATFSDLTEGLQNGARQTV